MRYKEINVKNAYRKITRKDDLFNGDYTIDPYQNCEFLCSYCDSSFEKTVYIKNNITNLLKNDLKKMPRSNFIIGSVHDPYQKIEEKKKLTRKILKLIKENDHTCHILTKSDLVLRDSDIIKEIKESNVTISITTYEEKLRQIFEKNVISADKRIKLIKKLRKNSINSGIAIIPVIPYITEDEIPKIIDNSNDIDANYYLYRYLELKGDQKRIFFEIIKNNFEDRYEQFTNIYKKSILPDDRYLQKNDTKIKRLFEKKKLKNTII